MSIWVSLFLADLINNMAMCSMFISDHKKKNDLISRKFILKYIILIVVITSISTLLFRSTSKMIKTIIKILVTSILLKNHFKENLSKMFMKIFLIYIIFAFYDMLFGLVYIGVLQLPTTLFNNNWEYILIGNIIIALSVYLTLQIKAIGNFIKNIANWYSGKSTINLVVNIALCVMSLWVFINRNTTGTTSLYDYIINSGVIIIIMIFVIGFFKENSDKNQIKKEYDNLLNYAKMYEQEVVEKSKWQHEYENQLIMIKDRVDPENKKAIRYINKLLRSKPSNENSQWLGKLSKFPDIGIKGLLHYKICQMIQNNIQVYVDVIDEDLMPTKIPEKLLEENLQDISMALGVYLDNAMQAASESDNKYLIVEFMCTKKQIVFQISNTYKGNVSIDKMDQERFSTKGKNHGYGLSIVRDILAKNKHLSQEKEMNGMYYVQKLIFNFE